MRVWNELYLSVNAPLSVNISAHIRRQFTILYLELTQNDDDEYLQSLMNDHNSERRRELAQFIDSLEVQMVYNLLDTFARFSVYEPYKILKLSMERRENFSAGLFDEGSKSRRKMNSFHTHNGNHWSDTSMMTI